MTVELRASRFSQAEKLRRAAQKAAISNRITNIPWRAATAWAQGAFYQPGQVVSSNGQLFVLASGAGTSAAAGVGPGLITHVLPTRYNGLLDDADSSPSGNFWLHIGPVRTTVTADLAPTVSWNNTVPNGTTYPVFYDASVFPELFQLNGGFADPAVTDFISPYTLDNSPSATKIQANGSVEFMTNSEVVILKVQKPGLKSTLFRTYKVYVDDRDATPSNMYAASAGTDSTYITIVLSGKKATKVRVAFGSYNNISQQFGGVYTVPGGRVWKPENPDYVRCALISDSQVGAHNYNNYVPGEGIPDILGANLGWDVWNYALSGMGYTDTGDNATYDYETMVAQAALSDPDVWVIFGSTNDNSASGAAITAKALATYQAIRATSDGPIVVFGCVPNSSSNIDDVETAIEAAVDALGDPWTFFAPIVGDTIPWINNAALPLASLNNYNLDLAIDAAHLHERGNRLFASMMEAVVRRDVLPVL